MNQTEEYSTKRVFGKWFGEITLLVSDYLIFLQFNSLPSSYRIISYFGLCSFAEVTILLCVDVFTIMTPLFKAILNFCTTNDLIPRRRENEKTEIGNFSLHS